jgi:hypothetical protein
MRSIQLVFAFSVLAMGQDTGVPPRPKASDYPSHQDTKSATLAAAVMPAKQLERMFGSDIAKHYVVLEVAVYPQNGDSVDVGRLDFGLKSGDAVTYAEKPRDVATPWPEKDRIPDRPVTVVGETGVVYGRSSDPVNGKRSGWGVYEGVGVTNDPRAKNPPSPPRQGPDPLAIEQRVRETMLPEGKTTIAVAGYLFFPQYKSKRQKGLELQWNKNGLTAVLLLPEK